MAWTVGLACAAVVAGLAYLALPLLPATVDWMAQSGGRPDGVDAAPADDLGPTEPA